MKKIIGILMLSAFIIVPSIAFGIKFGWFQFGIFYLVIFVFAALVCLVYIACSLIFSEDSD